MAWEGLCPIRLAGPQKHPHDNLGASVRKLLGLAPRGQLCTSPTPCSGTSH